MNLSRVDHTAIVVENLDSALDRYFGLFRLSPSVRSAVNDQGVEVAFLPLGDTQLELISPLDSGSGVARFLARHGEGLHHIGIVVDDLDAYVRELEAAGVRIPHREALGPLRREILLSPKDLCGVVVQVIEWKEGDAPTPEASLEAMSPAVLSSLTVTTFQRSPSRAIVNSKGRSPALTVTSSKWTPLPSPLRLRNNLLTVTGNTLGPQNLFCPFLL